MSENAEPLVLDIGLCRARQQWLCGRLAQNEVSTAIIVAPENVQYLTGFRPHRLMAAAAVLRADGHCTLIAPNSEPDSTAADDIRTFEAQWHSTLRQEQMESIGEVLSSLNLPPSESYATEFSLFPPHAAQHIGMSLDRLTDVEPWLWERRRRKDADELEFIARAIACTDAMYARAREVIRPGIRELDVFRELESAAVRVAGEPLTALGNDYQANSPGGSPRLREAEDGELFVLDLGPAYRGFYADNCRTFTVGETATDTQLEAWSRIVATLDMVERTVKPGVSCKALFEEAQSMLDEYRVGAFFHHLGHGFGLYPHEAPHLNPNWDDTFQEGDVFTAEPGLYGEELRAGIRLEQNYRVTADGVERLTSFPLEL